MTVTTAVGGDPRNMAALVTISRGMMIGGGPISKIEAHIASAGRLPRAFERAVEHQPVAFVHAVEEAGGQHDGPR